MADWISAETEQKERDFRGLLRLHVTVCRAILGRQRHPQPYLFMDLHGGPGDLVYRSRAFPGSPLIALNELNEAGLPYETWHWERNPTTATHLRLAVARADHQHAASVQAMAFEEGLPEWLKGQRRQPWRLGLVYSDPIKEPIPVEALNTIAQQFPKVDLLAYVSATNQYKRANANGVGHGRRLAEDIQAVNKSTILIREPRRAEHYTFILWSNWVDLPAWTKRGSIASIHRGARRSSLWSTTPKRSYAPCGTRRSLSPLPNLRRIPSAPSVPRRPSSGLRAGRWHL